MPSNLVGSRRTDVGIWKIHQMVFPFRIENGMGDWNQQSLGRQYASSQLDSDIVSQWIHLKIGDSTDNQGENWFVVAEWMIVQKIMVEWQDFSTCLKSGNSQVFHVATFICVVFQSRNLIWGMLCRQRRSLMSEIWKKIGKNPSIILPKLTSFKHNKNRAQSDMSGQAWWLETWIL